MLIYEMAPSALTTGSPYEADKFLVTCLWKAGEEDSVPHDTVMYWAMLLRRRGEEFASHASVCQYWLYEHGQRRD